MQLIKQMFDSRKVGLRKLEAARRLLNWRQVHWRPTATEDNIEAFGEIPADTVSLNVDCRKSRFGHGSERL